MLTIIRNLLWQHVLRAQSGEKFSFRNNSKLSMKELFKPKTIHKTDPGLVWLMQEKNLLIAAAVN